MDRHARTSFFDDENEIVGRTMHPSIADDVSFSTTTFAGRSTMGPRRSAKRPKIRRSDLCDLSVAMDESEIFDLYDHTVVPSDVTALIRSPLNELHDDFLRTYHTMGKPRTVFDALASFIDICTDKINSMCSRRSVFDSKGNDLSWLINERNTWRLIYALYKDRHLFADDEMDSHMSQSIIQIPSEKDVMEMFYKNNRHIREAQMVVDWLEKNARDEYQLGEKIDVGHYTDRTIAWENTLHQIQNKHVAFKSSSKDIVESVDPDAPAREGRPLHNLDAEDDSRLLKQIFQEIRRGQLNKAQELCIHCGQAWRAATLDGWRLFHDPNVSSKDTTVKLDVEGNPHRDVWKLCAWRMCQDHRVNAEEKAIMGALCGHVDAVLPFCSTWEDRLWALTKAAIDVAVELDIRDNSLRELASLPDKFWNNRRSMDEILHEIGTDENERPDRVIQEMIMLSSEEDLVKRCSEWCSSQECSLQFARFSTHVVLFLRLVGHDDQGYGDDVIKAYIKGLMQERSTEAVAFYCSLLPEDDQVELFSQFMESVVSQEERSQCLSAATWYNLKIAQITERVVQTVRTKPAEIPDVDDPSLYQETTPDDLKKISALDWLLYYPNQRVNALWETNAVIRHFVALNKINAARLAFDKIPQDSLEIIMRQFNCTVNEQGAADTTNLTPKADSAIKEYLCHKAYLQAHEGFAHWFNQFHNTKPVKPKEPPTKNFCKMVMYDHQFNKYNDDLERWSASMAYETKKVQAQLQNVILFPDDGWLVDNRLDEEPRKSDLERLRQICIPQMFALLHKVLHSMEMFEELYAVIDLMVNARTKYFTLFNNQQMTQMLNKMKETCSIIAAKTNNPFGQLDPSELEGPSDDDENSGPKEVAAKNEARNVGGSGDQETADVGNEDGEEDEDKKEIEAMKARIEDAFNLDFDEGAHYDSDDDQDNLLRPAAAGVSSGVTDPLPTWLGFENID